MAANLHGPVAHALASQLVAQGLKFLRLVQPGVPGGAAFKRDGLACKGSAIQTPGTAARRAGDVGIAVLCL